MTHSRETCRRKDLERREVSKLLHEQAIEDGIYKPWLQRNVPMKPPPSVAVSTSTTPDKVWTYTKEDLEAEGRGTFHREERQMDVLTMKIGFALDARYALPDQVNLLIGR